MVAKFGLVLFVFLKMLLLCMSLHVPEPVSETPLCFNQFICLMQYLREDCDDRIQIVPGLTRHRHCQHCIGQSDQNKRQAEAAPSSNFLVK